MEENQNPFAPSSHRGNKPFARAKRTSAKADGEPKSERDAFLESIGAVGINENGQPIGSTGGVIPLGADDSSRWSALNKAEVASPAAPAAAPGFLSAGLNEGTAPGLSEPNQYIQSALAKRPADRSLQEKEALKVRSRAEEITTKGGGKVMGGIMTDLIAEERAPGIGRREAKAALGYYAESEKELAAGGRNMDGTKREQTQPAAAASTTTAKTGTSGGTMTRGSQTTAVPGTPTPTQPGQPPTALPTGARPAISSVGFAMRTMPDGSVRTASGLNAAGSSNMQSFDTKDAAMAFYRPQAQAPQPGPMAPQAPAPVAQAPAPIAQPQPAQPAPAQAPQAPAQPPVKSPFSPASDQFLKTGVAPSALDYINGPDTSTKMQTPEAARTTSPTARLEMSGGMPGAPVKAPASSPAPAINQPPAAVPNSTMASPFATPSQGGATDRFMGKVKEVFSDVTANAIWNKPTGGNLYPDRSKNPFSSNRPEYEMGTPKPRGFQETSQDVEIANPFSR